MTLNQLFFVLFPPPDAQQSPAVAAQDLTSVFKAGYLEKRRKGECSLFLTSSIKFNAFIFLRVHGKHQQNLLSYSTF